MSFNPNQNNLNRLNIPPYINFMQQAAAASSAAAAAAAVANDQPPLLTPRTVTKIILSNVNQQLFEHFDYQTYFNSHGLCGRRSVSPTAAYYPDYDTHRSINHHHQHHHQQQQQQQHHHVSYPTAFNYPAVNKPFDSHFSSSNYQLQQQQQQLQQQQQQQQHHHQHHQSHHSNHAHQHPTIHYGISNTYSLVEPSTPNSLKIPTTPTRSKSLSPSLRTVIQPPRIRHKQQAAAAASSASKATVTTTQPSSSESNSSHKRHQTEPNTSLSSSSQQQQQQQQQQQHNSLPIMTNNPAIIYPSLSLLQQHQQSQKSSSFNTNSSSFQQQQQQQQVQSTHQIQKPIPILPTKQIAQHQHQHQPQQSNSQNEAKKTDESRFQAQKLQQQKQQQQLQQEQRNEQPNTSKKSSFDFDESMIPVKATDKENNLNKNSNKIPAEIVVDANENDPKKQQKLAQHIQLSESKDSNAKKHAQHKSEKEQVKKEEIKEVKMIKFKLPFNVRMMNLSNFPQNSNINSKKSSRNSKSTATSSASIAIGKEFCADSCLNILRKNLQFSVNENIKQLFDDYKKDFIQPAIENMRKNRGNNYVSEEDTVNLCIQLLDEAKLIFTKEIEKLNETLNNQEKSSKKRKSLYDAFYEKEETKFNDDVAAAKRLKLNNLDETVITSRTKFVLGKNANKLFLMYNTNNNNNLTDNNNNDASSNNKSIYTKYPNLFKYESDQADKKWLFDNSFIQKKVVKCYLLLYSDLNEIFMPTNTSPTSTTSSSSSSSASLNANSSTNNKDNASNLDSDDENCDHSSTNNNVTSDDDTADEMTTEELKATAIDEDNSKNLEFFNQTLKPFKLPESIIYKIKKQYSNFKRNNNNIKQ